MTGPFQAILVKKSSEAAARQGKMRYAADPETERLAVQLDALVALHHRLSGLTHVLAPPAPQILAALGRQPADAPELLERIASEFEIEGGIEALQARLEELEAAGLVWRLSA